MKAFGYAAATAKAPLAPYEFERRDPRAHDVVVDIQYCGVCHSDIHQTRAEWGEKIFPMVPGHEITGVVSAVGGHVSKFRVGQRVGVGVMVDSCGQCDECLHDMEQYCSVAPVFTYDSLEHDGMPAQGGYSDKIVVDENFVFRMPDNLPLDAAAPLLCAGITLYSPLVHWKTGPGLKVAVVGLGGLGHMGVKFAHALGADVTVLSHTLRKQADGKRLGADHYHATSDPETFKTLKRRFDLIVNTVSTDIDWNDYLNLLRTDGTMVIVGLPENKVPVDAFALSDGRRSLAGSSIGGLEEIQAMLDFCGQHNIVCDIERIPMQTINEAYERVLKSDVRYRFVIDMASLKAN